jgi:hypothetical protein
MHCSIFKYVVIAAHYSCHRVHIYYDPTIKKVVLEFVVFISDFLVS